MKGRLDKYDVHLKTIDGVNKQTVLGAFLSVLSFILIIYLIVSETSQYFSKDVVSRMITDTYQSRESIRIVMDIEFSKISCERISYSQEITRGSIHISDEGQNIKKNALVTGSSNMTDSGGCHVFCETITDKVGGIIKFSITHPQVPEDFIIVPFESPDLTHKINSLSFLSLDSTDVPGVDQNPLRGQTSVGTGMGIYQYAMQIVPTQYKTLHNEVSTAHHISVSERQVKLETALRGVIISSQTYKDFVGILITYDFYPVRLHLIVSYISYTMSIHRV